MEGPGYGSGWVSGVVGGVVGIVMTSCCYSWVAVFGGPCYVCCLLFLPVSIFTSFEAPFTSSTSCSLFLCSSILLQILWIDCPPGNDRLSLWALPISAVTLVSSALTAAYRDVTSVAGVVDVDASLGVAASTACNLLLMSSIYVYSFATCRLVTFPPLVPCVAP